jgi:hypothetical protein
MTYMVYANGYVRAECYTEALAWQEAENVVAQGSACAEVYAKVGEVQRTKVEYERVKSE